MKNHAKIDHLCRTGHSLQNLYKYYMNFQSLFGGNAANTTTELISEVALGTMAGLVSGYTLKKLGQLISLGLLAGYSGLQFAKMRGWVKEDQINTITKTVKGLGQQGKEQLPSFNKYVQGFVKVGVPSVISFSGGFYIGFFYG